MKFKKITAITASVLMTGLSVATAAAAAWHSPFIEDGKANVAIVYGHSDDLTSANSVHSALGEFVTSTGAETTTGGDVISLDKKSDKFQLGYNLASVYTSGLDDGEMKDFLADEDYHDGKIDSEFTQKIKLGSSTPLSLFADNDYDKDKTPTLGFHFDGDEVLTYTMNLKDSDEKYLELEDTNLPLMGNEYYVLEAKSSELILLDSSKKASIKYGETITFGEYTVEATVISENYAKFTVNGEPTDKLADTGSNYDRYFKLKDGSYIVLTSNEYASKEADTSSAEISIGKGKITLDNNGGTVEINDKSIEGLTSKVFDASGVIVDDTADSFKKIELTWKTDGEEFLTEGKSMVMPGFETIKVLFGGLNFPTESEKISIDKGEAVTLDMENFDVEMFWTSTTANAVLSGTEDHFLERAADHTADTKVYTYTLAKDERFLATDLDEDLDDVTQLYYEVDKITKDSNDKIDLTLTDLTDGDDDIKIEDELAANADDDSRDDVILKVDDVFKKGLIVSATTNATHISVADAATAAIKGRHWTTSNDNSPEAGDVLLNDVVKFTLTTKENNALSQNFVVSKKGMTIELPTTSDLAGDTDLVKFYDAKDDGDLQSTTMSFSADLAFDADDKEVYAVKTAGINFKKVSDDNYVGYVLNDLATKVDYNSKDDSFEVEYYGQEIVADVKIASSDAVISNAAAADYMPVLASEIDSVKDKNLIIVGGSCINSAAAKALGGAYCGEAFTEATGVTLGNYLIKEVKDVFTQGKIALVVAGYEKADTNNAVTYLTTTKDVYDASKGIVKGIVLTPQNN